MITKKHLILYFLLFISSWGQQESKSSFTLTNLSIHSGVSFTKISDGKLVLGFEGSTNISVSIFIKLGLSYYQIDEIVNKSIKTFDYVNIQSIEKYYAISYTIEEKQYQVISLFTGTQYFFGDGDMLNPYLNFEAAYNFLDPFIKNSERTYYGDYDNFDELPAGFRNSYQEYYPLSSFRFSFGIGTEYNLSNFLSVDIRYQYLYDTELLNTHQFLVGVIF